MGSIYIDIHPALKKRHLEMAVFIELLNLMVRGIPPSNRVKNTRGHFYK